MAAVQLRVGVSELRACVAAAGLATGERAGGDEPRERVRVPGELLQVAGGTLEAGEAPHRLPRLARWRLRRSSHGLGAAGGRRLVEPGQRGAAAEHEAFR